MKNFTFYFRAFFHQPSFPCSTTQEKEKHRGTSFFSLVHIFHSFFRPRKLLAFTYRHTGNDSMANILVFLVLLQYVIIVLYIYFFLCNNFFCSNPKKSSSSSLHILFLFLYNMYLNRISHSCLLFFLTYLIDVFVVLRIYTCANFSLFCCCCCCQ